MPDWCDNFVTITGPKETVQKLWDDAVSAEGLLDAMVPRPRELNETQSPSQDTEERQEELLEKYGASNWYDWSVSRWGTKWDVSLEGLELTENLDGTASISGWFESAWSPPIQAYEIFSDEMNECCITASYLDQNSYFGGFFSTIDGDEHLDDLRAEYEKEEENRSDIYRRLDEQYDISAQFQDWGGSIPDREEDGDRSSRRFRRRLRRRRKLTSTKRRRLRRKRRS